MISHSKKLLISLVIAKKTVKLTVGTVKEWLGGRGFL